MTCILLVSLPVSPRDLRLLAVSAQITEITYSISDIQTRIFGQTANKLHTPCSDTLNVQRYRSFGINPAFSPKELTRTRRFHTVPRRTWR